MNTDCKTATENSAPTAPHAPSADFIQAISDFLDTDPQDLLMELGYYSREDHVSTASDAEAAASAA